MMTIAFMLSNLQILVQEIKMAIAFDGTHVPDVIQIPCGEAHFDEGSGYGYRCWNCMAVIGSIAMPKDCKTLMEENVSSFEDLTKKKMGFKYEKFKEDKHYNFL